MTDLTKSQKKHLRQLAKDCFEKEMSLALEDLFQDFKKWKNNEISTWDLTDKIHEHLNKKGKELGKLYVDLNDPRIALSRAVVKGIIKIEDVQENCRPLLQGLIEFYRSEN